MILDASETQHKILQHGTASRDPFRGALDVDGRPESVRDIQTDRREPFHSENDAVLPVVINT